MTVNAHAFKSVEAPFLSIRVTGSMLSTIYQSHSANESARSLSLKRNILGVVRSWVHILRARTARLGAGAVHCFALSALRRLRN